MRFGWMPVGSKKISSRLVNPTSLPNLIFYMKIPPSEKNLAAFPQYARDAKSYVLVRGAENISSGLRESKWPTVLKFSGVKDGIDKARAEGGVTRRHFLTLYRADLLVYDVVVLRDPENFENEYPEGAQNYRIHRQIERNGLLPNWQNRNVSPKQENSNATFVTSTFLGQYGELGENFIEAHHTVPVSEMRGRCSTTLSSNALVCSNCHRMLHRGKSLRTVKDLRAALKSAGKMKVGI